MRPVRHGILTLLPDVGRLFLGGAGISALLAAWRTIQYFCRPVMPDLEQPMPRIEARS